jgi:hypothetical protein
MAHWLLTPIDHHADIWKTSSRPGSTSSQDVRARSSHGFGSGVSGTASATRFRALRSSGASTTIR